MTTQVFATDVLECVAMDIVVNLPHVGGMKHILTMVDMFSRYCWAVPIPDRKAETVADALYAAIIGEHGARYVCAPTMSQPSRAT